MRQTRLLIILPFCGADRHLTKALLDRIGELGGCPQNDLLLILADGQIPLNPFKSNYQNITSIRQWCVLPNEAHPIGANIMFETALKYVRKNPQPFLWLEPDAVPMRKGWLREIEDEYAVALSEGKSILSCVTQLINPRWPKAIPSGVSVYPPDAWKLYEGLKRNEGWDVQFANRIMPHVHESKLIVNRLNHVDAPHFVSGLKVQVNDMRLSDIPAGTCLFHPCKDGSLTALLKSPTSDRKQQAMNETSKAMRRRRCEEAAGGFKWSEIFSGKGIDVGAGGDPIQLPNCKPFDMHDGDANHLSRYVSKESLDYLHASQCLEHMHDPTAAILDWAVCVKPVGHLIVSVPDFDLYEKTNWPSRFNPDHKSAWSTWRKAAKGVPLVHVPLFCRYLMMHGLRCVKIELVDTHFDYCAPDAIDQTLPEDGAECFIEIVFRKAAK